MGVKINEREPCVYYDLELGLAECQIHSETMQSVITHYNGGYIRGGTSGPGSKSDTRRVRFFLETHCVEFYEKAMGIYEYPDPEKNQ